MLHGALQSRRLALASCCHHRLGADAHLANVNVVYSIGQLVFAQSLLTREEAAVELSAKLRARALRGETIMLGMVVRFARDGEAEYVGSEDGPEQDCYTFRFGSGATARTERMYLARMQPEQWCVLPCIGAGARDAIVESLSPKR